MMWLWRQQRPKSRVVAERAMILNCVVGYATIVPASDFFSGNAGEVRSSDMHKMLAAKAREQLLGKLGRLRARLSPWEHTFFYGPEITRQQRVDASWRLEAFQILVWALGLIPARPAYDTEAGDGILRAYPPGELDRYAKTARLRADTEIDHAREVAALWHWRSRTRLLIERGDTLAAKLQTDEIKTYDDLVRLTARRAHEKGDIPATIEGDFPVRGKAYRALNAQEWSRVASISRERHFALNWLCGHAPGNRWDKTPTDT